MTEKISVEEIKKLPFQSLNRMLKKLRKFLKNDPVVREMFEKYDVDINEIDFIPMRFDDLDVSAKTDHGVIIFNYKLLTDGDFFKDFSYGVHEITHYLQQSTGNHPTQSSDDGSYLDNPAEQESFQNQIDYISDHFGDNEADNYVEHLLDHHDITSNKEKEDKKEILMAKV